MRSPGRALCPVACAAVVLLPRALLAVGFDIESQSLLVEHISPEVRVEIVAEVRLLESAPRTELNVFRFALPIVAASVNGAAAVVADNQTYAGYVHDITAALPAVAGEIATVRLSLAGELDCAFQQDPAYVTCVSSPSELFLTPSEVGRAWYLGSLYGWDFFSGTVDVRVPAGHSVVAGQGAPTAVTRNTDGSFTWSFAVAQPAVFLGLYAGTGEAVRAVDGFPTIGYITDASQRESMVALVETASKVLPYYADIYGGAPMQEAHILVAPANSLFGGAGLLGNVLLSEGLVSTAYDVPGGDRSAWLRMAAAHEFAHTWWAGLVIGDSPFFSESFAEYSAWRALGQVFGEEMRMSGDRMNAVWYMFGRADGADVAVLDPQVDSSPAYVPVVYHKGPLVLRQIEELAGQEAFTAALRALLAGAPAVINIDDLLAALDAVGYDAGRAVDEWLRATSYPVLSVHSVLSGDVVRLSVTMTGEFHVRLPLRLRFADGTKQESAFDIGPGTTSVELTANAGLAPVAVEIDPRWTFVRAVRPALPGDVTLDGQTDAADLIEIALHAGAKLPSERRVDGRYDPLYDLNEDRSIDAHDLSELVAKLAAESR